jgi:hypothetical protein
MIFNKKTNYDFPMENYVLEDTYSLFVWIINHQPAVLFSQSKSASSNQTKHQKAAETGS